MGSPYQSSSSQQTLYLIAMQTKRWCKQPATANSSKSADLVATLQALRRRPTRALTPIQARVTCD